MVKKDYNKTTHQHGTIGVRFDDPQDLDAGTAGMSSLPGAVGGDP